MNSERANPNVDRRQFLVTAGACLAGAVAQEVPSATAAVSPGWKMRLSASSIAFSKLPFEAACQRIAAIGFEAIDIWSAHAGCPHLDDVQKRLGPTGLNEVLARHKLKLYAFSVYAGGYARYADLLGAAGGGVAIRGAPGPEVRQGVAAEMKRFLEGLKPELELAEKNRSFLAIENHGDTLLGSLDSFRAFVETNRHPRLGIALAPYHLEAAGVSVEQAIEVVGKQLLFFYAWHHASGVKQLPGLGETDCTPWLRALARVNYQGYVNPFLHDEPAPDPTAAALTKSRDYLNACYRRIVAK